MKKHLTTETLMNEIKNDPKICINIDEAKFSDEPDDNQNIIFNDGTYSAQTDSNPVPEEIAQLKAYAAAGARSPRYLHQQNNGGGGPFTSRNSSGQGKNDIMTPDLGDENGGDGELVI